MPVDPHSPSELSPHRYIALAPRPPDGPLQLADLWQEKTGDIELEIGFGRGMFLLERAKSAPQNRLLGIEIKNKWAYLVQQRAEQAGFGRVCVFAADAREFVPRLQPAGGVARVFMHFPDPWWKKKHAKRRLRGAETLDPIARVLAPGGEFFVQTDVEERAEEFVADLRAHGAFELVGDPYIEDHAFGARSNREKRAIADGLPVFRISALKRS